jgi:hypothetical protein
MIPYVRYLHPAAYEFRLDPLQHQPSGSCNLERLFSGDVLLTELNLKTGKYEVRNLTKEGIAKKIYK